MTARHQLAVIGAGPAGMAAAVQADALGLDTVLLDEQGGPGGQIYRSVERSPLRGTRILGPDYAAGAGLAAALRDSAVEYRPGAGVWHIEPGFRLALSDGDGIRLIAADRVILATGALERPMPVAGWTLPGVMTAGAAQLLLKSSALAADGAVFAGCGPLLYLVAAQYLRAGLTIRAILDTTDPADRRSALASLSLGGSALRTLAKGLGLLAEIRRAGVPVFRRVEDLRIVGRGRVAGVAFRRGGVWQPLDGVTTVFLHQGVVPNLQLAWAAGCPPLWDADRLCWTAETDAWGRSAVPGLLIAGDAAGIAGARAAADRGRLAALAAAWSLDFLSERHRDALARPLQASLRREAAIRPFLERLYRPRFGLRVPADNAVIVCRCEEVTAGMVRREARRGAVEANRLKSALRCGMGPCQGRICAGTVSELAAAASGLPVEAVGRFRVRPPIRPVPLDQLARLRAAETAEA
ncbi:NAD(P)/FAD-dependent oxidoreductase [Inquilinus limosus]|uniref:FAD/NAD(P)-dependent oxidoreductase n=1 Tax=Inquilinus limosus TaxID=171674 RepID=UPI003F141AD4